MGTLWEAGDSALCVWKLPQNDGLEVGKVYTVDSVVVCNEVGLTLAELPIERRCSCGGDHSGSWLADRFRRIKPDKREAGEECQKLLRLFKKRCVPELV